MIAFNCIFQYLRKEGFEIDKPEFLFQLQLHPDYPKLLAVVDTLNFFDVSAGAFKIPLEEYDLLPTHFVTFLDWGKGMELFLFEKNNENYFYFNGKKKISISKEDISSNGNGVFLLAENDNKIDAKNSGGFLKWLPFILLSVLLVFLLFSKTTSVLNLVFLLFPIIGLFLSIAALKDVFGIKSSLVDNLCNANSATDCTSVVNSRKWKFFEYLSFSDMSLLFFSTQLLSQILFLFIGSEFQFFMIQKALLYLTVPFIFLSVYYQKFVEKKWCTICLSIILILLLELSYLILFYKVWIFPFTDSLISLGIVCLSTLIVWQWVKKKLLKQKELQEFFIKGNRFSRNYDIFKNTLVTGKQVSYPDAIFELGNRGSERNVAISTNPFCGYCKDAHFLIEKISNKHPEGVSVKILLNIDLDMMEDVEKKEFCKRLVSIYLLQNPQR